MRRCGTRGRRRTATAKQHIVVNAHRGERGHLHREQCCRAVSLIGKTQHRTGFFKHLAHGARRLWPEDSTFKEWNDWHGVLPSHRRLHQSRSR